MGLLQTIRAVSNLATGLSATPVAVAGTEPAGDIISRSRAAQVALDIALSISAVRKALHVIAGTISTFDLIAWEPTTGAAIPPTDRRVAWLAQPDTDEGLYWTLSHTVSDLIWHDRSVWEVRDRYITGAIARANRLHPDRVDTLTHPLDRDRVDTWIVDGRATSRRNLLVIDGAGRGGLRRYGYDLLTLYGQLQAAAGRYATAPHPHAILKNSGADLTDEEIDALLADWEAARTQRSVGYLNEVMDYETIGWNAEELQLTEGREHAALEVARLFGLPAKALDAKSGDSMTYANSVDSRRDILEAIRPWMIPITAALSAATGCRIEFDADAYTRDDPTARMNTWAVALTNQVLDVDEVRALEPLAARRHP